MTKKMVFSSVGDNTNFDSLWINDNMDYDIYVIYYGDDENIFTRYKSKVHYIEQRKGSKFQNFKYFYEKNIEIINKYDYFFILDDDIVIDVNSINNMFKIASKYNLSICGPAFLESSKHSHKILKQKKDITLVYTNFVEVNTPLFNKNSLQNLMKWLDNSLIGWGIDFLYIWANGLNKKTDYAIIHSIGCINPYEVNKKNLNRELQLIDKWSSRQKIWKEYADKIHCPRHFKLEEYGTIYLDNNT